MTLQAIALAITRVKRIAFEILTERFICLVLEEFAPSAIAPNKQ